MTSADETRYVLKLFVTGSTPRSVKALAELRAICESRLKGMYRLEVIDLYRHPELAKGQQIIAVPTLVKEVPMPLRRIVGDLSDRDKILAGLGIGIDQDDDVTGP